MTPLSIVKPHVDKTRPTLQGSNLFIMLIFYGYTRFEGKQLEKVSLSINIVLIVAKKGVPVTSMKS